MTTRLIFSHSVLLLLGIVVGWKLSSRSGSYLRELAQIQKSEARDVGRSASALPPQAVPPSSKSTQAQIAESRLEALRWYSKTFQGGFLTVHVFEPNGKLMPEFVALFNLSSDQARQLQREIFAARDRITAQSISLAKTEVDPKDPNHLTIEIPSFATKGTDVYKDLLQSVTNTVGPDHAAAFNDLCGSAFDFGFNAFGANTQKYEVTAQTLNGRNYIAVNYSFSGPDGSGTSQNTLSPQDVSKFFPSVQKLLPPNFGQTPPSP